MKRMMIVALAMMSAVAASAQRMRIYLASGETATIQTSQIDSIAYLADDGTDTLEIVNGHICVDLGLSVKWAICNLGADSPDGYGDYLAWGETSPKESYTIGTSLTYGKELGEIGGDSIYDAATAQWGGTWRLPTVAEFNELYDNCAMEWLSQDGISGMRVTGPNGNTIFFPAADATSTSTGVVAPGGGVFGYYWTSTPYDPKNAYLMVFSENYTSLIYDLRYIGQSVRAVTF